MTIIGKERMDCAIAWCKRISFCSILMSLFFSHSALAVSEVTFYVVDFRPHIVVEGSQVTGGADVALVERAFAEVGIRTHFEVLPWTRILKLMKRGSIAGTLSCAKRDYRKNYVLFSDPIAYMHPVLISKKSLDTSQIKYLDQLKQYSITTVKDWALQTQLMRLGIAHRTAPTIESALRSVYYRDVDLMYMTESTSRYFMSKLGLDGDMKVTPLRGEDLTLELHLCLSKTYPDADILLEKFNIGLRAIQDPDH